MKISLKISLWYFVVTLTILLAFSLATYFGMKQLLFDAIDNELGIVKENIQLSFNPSIHQFQELNNNKGKYNPFLQYYIVIYDTNGSPVYNSLLAEDIQLNIPLVKEKISEGYTIITEVNTNSTYLKKMKNGEITFRIINSKLFYKNKFSGWITVGVSIERLETSMEKLLNVLLTSIILSVILIAVGGYFLTKKSLNPVDQITKRANKISHSNLTERIEIENEEDELGKLSIVLNNLLDRLQKAFENQKQFMADAAHELKTPLSILRSHWESELNNPELSLEIKETLVHDVETITRLNHLINNLLLLSQSDSSSYIFDDNKIRLDELISEVVSDTKILAEMKNHRLEIVDLPKIELRGDRMRLYQLFFNLIDNAIKYTQSGGTIWISMRQSKDEVKIEIRDNGPGIPAEDLPHIFDRFYRIQKDRNRKTGGSGLGLSICKLIAELHNGSCNVESKVGAGTSFIISLPLLFDFDRSIKN